MKCFSNTFVHYVYFFTLQKENRTGEHSTEGFNSYGVVRSHDALDCVVGFFAKGSYVDEILLTLVGQYTTMQYCLN